MDWTESEWSLSLCDRFKVSRPFSGRSLVDIYGPVVFRRNSERIYGVTRVRVGSFLKTVGKTLSLYYLSDRN